MRVLLYTDVHLSTFSSTLRKMGKKYSVRLENVIESVSWAEKLSADLDCDKVICLGDFFDKPIVTAEEITALKDIQWNEKIPHDFVIGNHESNILNLSYTTVNIFKKMNNFRIIDTPTVDYYNDLKLCFIPYILEENRKSLKDYINIDSRNANKTIVFSHNDIKGIDYGVIVSKEGFDKKEIEEQCSMFLNGHLHNGEKFCKNGMNLGNITGQNFKEDASIYEHGAFVLDTNDMSLTFYPNPYALNFYKIDINSENDFSKLQNLKQNALATIKCNEKYFERLRELLSLNDLFISYRIIITHDEVKGEVISQVLLEKTDHLKQFQEFTLNKLGSTTIVLEELSHIIEG